MTGTNPSGLSGSLINRIRACVDRAIPSFLSFSPFSGASHLRARVSGSSGFWWRGRRRVFQNSRRPDTYQPDGPVVRSPRAGRREAEAEAQS